ncbi:hypothetical protein IFT84_13150 [Rhizobium sp. CFBP 8762]|uniref:hypothetical protein n=1 Tax=Rhizobium sp. CFBP 8762 TaxID=2775279 RepID=UPI00177DF91F|nr:hypothetical protein [Rhizobium sp. CFBP 8762]MBD8555452.1 hypothetical protein [Rhizobium sp. CFBP 8762]
MPGLKKLIVLMAFDADSDGNLHSAFEAKQMDTEAHAIREAKVIADQHSGVIAWSREANPAVGEYGASVILFEHGNVPELEP